MNQQVQRKTKNIGAKYEKLEKFVLQSHFREWRRLLRRWMG